MAILKVKYSPLSTLRNLSYVCDVHSFSTVLLVILGPVMSVSYWLFQYSVIGDSGSCLECVILTLSVQCYWWFRVLSWVCHIDSFSTVLLVIQGPVLSVWYWLFQYSVIGDSGSCHECVILTLSVQCYWWFRVLSWVCDIDSFSTVLLVIPGNTVTECVIYDSFSDSVIGDSRVTLSLSVLYMTLSDSVIGDSRNNTVTECVIYDSFSDSVTRDSRNNTVMSVLYWLFQYSVIGDSPITLSWKFVIYDSFMTVLLVIHQ